MSIIKQRVKRTNSITSTYGIYIFPTHFIHTVCFFKERGSNFQNQKEKVKVIIELSVVSVVVVVVVVVIVVVMAVVVLVTPKIHTSN